MEGKADLFRRYLGLLSILFAVQLNAAAVVNSSAIQLVLTPVERDLVKYVNASTLVTCSPSVAHVKVRWISPQGKVVGTGVTERIHAEKMGDGTVALMLGRLQSSDAGAWRCEATETEEEIQQSFTLHVMRDIAFDDTPIVQEGDEGTMGLIRCEASGHPLPRIQWSHNGRPIPEHSKKYRKVADGLVIDRLRRTDSGEYTCQALQESPHFVNGKSKVIRFNVLHAPIFVNQRHIYYAYYYGVAELLCDVIADPPAQIKWTSKPMKGDFFTIKNYTINSSVLEVNVVDPVVIGKYNCVAENRLGTVEQTIELRNGTKPEPPKTFIVRGVNNSTVDIEVEQEELDYNSSSASGDEADTVTGYRFHLVTLDNYRWSVRTKNTTFWFPQREVERNVSENNSYLIGGLRPNTIYKIKVATLNKAGPSDFTEDREFTTSNGGIVRGGALVNLIAVFVVWGVFYQN